MKEFIIVIGLTMAAYNLGIVIRTFTIPGENALSLSRQLLLGMIAYIGVATPLLSGLSIALSQTDSNPQSLFFALGLFVEHGFFLNETITQKISGRKAKN